jgi:hypothetical protein
VEEMMKKLLLKTTAALLTAVMVLTLFCSCNLFNYGEEKDPVALETAVPVAYKMYRVVKGDIDNSLKGSATVESFGAVRHYFSGEDGSECVFFIKHIHVSVGQYVSEGTLIAEAEDEYGNDFSLYAEVSGFVKYVDGNYLNNELGRVMTYSYDTVVIIDPEDASRAVAAIKVLRTTDRGEMEPGDMVSLKVKKAEPFEGEIIGYAFEENWNIYYVSLENSPVRINIGEKVSYEYVIAESLDCLVIPKEVLYEYHGRQFVYVLDERGLRRERYVVAGISDSMRVEIVSGLEEGDLIIEY